MFWAPNLSTSDEEAIHRVISTLDLPSESTTAVFRGQPQGFNSGVVAVTTERIAFIDASTSTVIEYFDLAEITHWNVRSGAGPVGAYVTFILANGRGYKVAMFGQDLLAEVEAEIGDALEASGHTAAWDETVDVRNGQAARAAAQQRAADSGTQNADPPRTTDRAREGTRPLASARGRSAGSESVTFWAPNLKPKVQSLIKDTADALTESDEEVRGVFKGQPQGTSAGAMIVTSQRVIFVDIAYQNVVDQFTFDEVAQWSARTGTGPISAWILFGLNDGRGYFVGLFGRALLDTAESIVADALEASGHPVAWDDALVIRKGRVAQASGQEAKSRATVSREARAQRAAEAAARPEGRELARGVIGTKTVIVYERGFVDVRGLFGGSIGVERLIAIDGSADSQTKSAAGRTAGAVVTLGANVIFSPNKRGQVHLTIVTDKNTYSLKQDPPTDSAIRAVNQLLTTGRVAIDNASRAEGKPEEANAAGSSTAAPTLTVRLREAAELHRDGVLSDDEFAALKARIISGD